MASDPDWSALDRMSFGDIAALADRLLALILAGTKTATCSSASASSENVVVGQRQVVLNGAGNPRAVIETTALTRCRFDQVTAEFAFVEGEDDRTLASWQVEHRAFFERNGGFAEDMDLWCERFRLIERL